MNWKTVLNFFLLLFSSQAMVLAQCESEPKFEKADLLVRQDFRLNSPTETWLTIDARVFGASWEKKGTEAAVLTIFINGKYNQDVILYAGEESLSGEKKVQHEYEVFLGELTAGNNEIAVTLNKAQTPAAVKDVVVSSISPLSASLSDYRMFAKIPAGSKENEGFEAFRANFIARQNAPFIYARPNTIGKFSDIPLITYYEISGAADGAQRIRYTTIFTNEDGGTQSAALMARWGRMTDIEWIYEIEIKDGKIISEVYQGANHQTKAFTGKRVFGNHPLIFDQTDNNNVSDTGCSALRLAPNAFRADLSAGSRETVMDKNAWIYRIMAEEAAREGRINPANLGVNTIDDVRNYLYVETFAENKGAAVSLEIKDSNDKASRSDWDNAFLRIDRSGYFRIAVRLPESNSKINSITLRCHATSQKSPDPACANARIIKVLKLSENYELTELKFDSSPAANLKPDENIVYKIKK